jgi:hypothetical protein
VRAIALVLSLLVASMARADGPCAGERAALLVRDHRLTTCAGGREVASWPVALGRAGSGKRRAGDERTPSGRYPLGAPRRSAQYGTFIPVGYPTVAQRAQGYSGGEIGVHGPRRAMRWARGLNAALDWTRGCVALASDDAVAELARWVRAHPDATIVLE